jgi:MFS family permease
MATSSTSTTKTASAAQASWLALIVIMLAQLQMGFNVNALPVSIGPIVEDLNAPATAVGTAIVVYSLFVAAFVMLGAKLGKLFGARLVFQVGVIAHGISMGMMAISTDANTMNNAQIIAGIAAAMLVPTLVVLIASNYQGRQQEQALGILASAPAIASGLAFVIAGILSTILSWRYSFGLLLFVSIAVLILSFRMTPVPRTPGVKIDLVGVVLSAASIALILIGFNNINAWGFLLAKSAAPFSLLGLSPALFAVVLGIVAGQGFFAWSERRIQDNKTPLLALEVLDTPEERNAVFAFLVAGGLGPAVSFLIPLYIQIVQDRSPLFTAIAILPYTLAIAAAAILTVRLYDRFSPRLLGTISFVLVALGLVIVAFTVSNDWGTIPVIVGLIIAGIGEGTLLTLLFNVLVSASPKELAGDVGALRGVVNNVSSALGTALGAVVAVSLLGLIITTSFNQSNLPAALEREINFDQINFVSNDQLKEVLAGTSVTTPEQVDEAVAINAAARLRALRAAFLILAAIALLAIIPATRLPNYVPGEIPSGEAPKSSARAQKRKKEAIR